MEVDCDSLLFGMELRIFLFPHSSLFERICDSFLSCFLSFLSEFANMFILKYLGMP